MILIYLNGIFVFLQPVSFAKLRNAGLYASLNNLKLISSFCWPYFQYTTELQYFIMVPSTKTIICKKN